MSWTSSPRAGTSHGSRVTAAECPRSGLSLKQPRWWTRRAEAYAAAARIVEAGDWLVWQLSGTLVRNSCAAGFKALWHQRDGYPAPTVLRELRPELFDLFTDRAGGRVEVPAYRSARCGRNGRAGRGFPPRCRGGGDHRRPRRATWRRRRRPGRSTWPQHVNLPLPARSWERTVAGTLRCSGRRHPRGAPYAYRGRSGLGRGHVRVVVRTFRHARMRS